MITGEDKFVPDKTDIEDCIAEMCSKYKQIKHIKVKRSLTHPFEIEIILEGTVDNKEVVQHLVLDIYYLVGKSESFVKNYLASELDRRISDAKLFSKGGRLV